MNEWGGYGKRTRDAMRFQSNADSVFASEGVLSEKDPLAFRERRMQASGAQVAALLQSGVLNGRERAILISRFGLSEGSEPQTLKETGQKFGITKERVRQIQGKALGKLRTLVADKKMPLAADDVV
jgi:DNA-directed RNA polymerase sigma subunit (sigma70/sigma32)